MSVTNGDTIQSPSPDAVRIAALLADPDDRLELVADEAFRLRNEKQLSWLMDRLSKSTAGVRGEVATDHRLPNIDPLAAADAPQLGPVVIAVLAQAYAEYLVASDFRSRGRETPSAFVGFDPRFLSPQYGDLFTRIFSANGVAVGRDQGGIATPTPVTSFMSVLLGLDSGIQITASHNPPNHNGVKSSTWYGGVDTDDISDAIAARIRTLVYGGSGRIRIGPRASELVRELDAKQLYTDHYLRKTFPPQVVRQLASAFRGGVQVLFDGLHGVGGGAMRRYLELLLPDGEWRGAVHLINEAPDPRIGGIEKPDPSTPETLIVSGAIDRLAANPEITISVTADMDADRIGTAVRVPSDRVAEARRYGLFVSTFDQPDGQPVNVVRFTPNQVFTLIAFDRLLAAAGAELDTLDDALASKRAAGADFHILTSIASSVLAELVARRYDLKLHQTAVGFKNLGKRALEIDRSGSGNVVLALMEESGGAQIGPFEPWNEHGDTIHRDKDTCALALALFGLAARLGAAGGGRSVLDFYVDMARQLGGLAYFERLDAYLPDRATAEKAALADLAEAAKSEVLDRLHTLLGDHDSLIAAVAEGDEAAVRLPDRPLEEIHLLVKRDGVWVTVHPTATRYQKGDRVIEFYPAGMQRHDGARINVYRVDGDAERVTHWCLVRASGTEALLRVYMEIVEPVTQPRPGRLFTQFEPLLRALGLDQYREKVDGPDYVTAFATTIASKYVDG